MPVDSGHLRGLKEAETPPLVLSLALFSLQGVFTTPLIFNSECAYV